MVAVLNKRIIITFVASQN